MQILIDKLFNWDESQQRARGPGIFGTVVGFAPADEEQGRKTLHRHIQLWVKDVDQGLRRDLFHDDLEQKLAARNRLQNYVDKIMSATFGHDLILSHNQYTPSKSLFVDAPMQTFRDARHEDLCRDVCGEVIEDTHTGQTFHPMVFVDHSLKYWRDCAYQDAMCAMTPDVYLQMIDERADMAAYTHSYHMPDGSNPMSHHFWGDEKVRQILLHKRFNVHEAFHRHSCFKKDCECRFLFPFTTCEKTYIHEDLGEDDENIISWHNLDGTTRQMAPWMIIPKRPMGCQYVNVHNPTISELFSCNTNVQVGDPIHMFYITLYNLKSTQKEDSERSRNITKSIIRRLLRIQDEVRAGNHDEVMNEPDFAEGLCRMLGGMYAATSRYVVSSTMAHLLGCQNGTRFKFSHNFSDLLVTQLEAVLEGNPIDFRLRVNSKDGEEYVWKDISSYAYLYRPNNGKFEKMCSFRLFMKYKTKYLTFEEMDRIRRAKKKNASNDSDDTDDDDIYENRQKFNGNIFPFLDGHPGKEFSHLAELDLEEIPKISLPEGKLCDVALLKVLESDVDETVHELRENYAKMALLMFYPFRTLKDLRSNGSYWTTFWNELSLHREGKECSFWPKGFEILQNIQDRLTVEKHMKRAKDPVLLTTTCQKAASKAGGSARDNESKRKLPDISEFCTLFE